MKKHSKTFITSVAILMLVFGIGLNYLLEMEYIGVRKNTSESLPFTYFIAFKNLSPQKGSYVTIDHPHSPSMLLAKKIIGIVGDQILVSGGKFYINGSECGVMRPCFNHGAPLTPIQESTIPPGYVFVYGTHPDSFDSRYAEFGLVSTQFLREVLWPLF